MPFNVPEEKKPEFNKQVKKGLELLTGQINETALQAAASEPLPIDYSSLISDIEQGVIQEGALEPPRVEIDAIRDADGNIISNPLDLLSTPLNENKSKALGLIDAEGNATDKGELFFNMKEAGMFDDAGVITDKGKAYLLPKDELLKEENRQAFRMLWDDGVIREEAKTEDMVDAVLEAGGEALSGVGNILSLTAQNLYYQFDNRKGWAVPFFRGADTDNRPQELIDKTIAGNLSIVDKFTTNTLDLARMADVASAWAIAELKDPANWGESAPAPKDSTDELYAARQRQMATRETIKNMAAGEAAEVIVGLPNAVAVAEEARKSLGPDEFDKVYGKISTTMDFFGGAENIVPAAFAFKMAKGVPLATRASLTAQKNITKVLAQELEIATRQTSIEAARLTVEKGNTAVALANKIAQKGAQAGADAATIARAERAAEIANRTVKITDEAAATIPRLTSELDELTRIRNSTATRIPEIASKAAIKTLEAGRALRGMPASAIGSVLEGFGSTLTKVDNTITNFLKERGIDQMYTAGVGAAGVAGVAGSPVIGSIAAGAAALKAGKAITNYGKLFKYVGKEMTQVRGQIPFWKRVAAHTEPSSLNRGIAHAFNILDLGGVTSDTLRRIPRGVAAAYPVDLMFEYLSDGGDMRPQTFYQAAAESLVIGGSFAAAGGAFMGTKSRMRELSNGDRVNFMQNISDPRQKVLYGELSPGNQKAIATYSIANPTLNYVFKESGGSNYDPNTNTATINVRSNNSIKPLIAHETLHHTVIKNNMEAGISALFLGDTINNTVGGLLRSKDGKLDPNFEAFKDSYYQRLRSAGMTNAEINATYPLDKVAVEYFIEQHADQYAEMAESGELGATAASGDIKRKLSGVLETVLPRIPVLKELHFKSGGMIDKDGGWVTGNGILDADGVKTNPIAKKMFKDMNRRSAGLTPGQFEPLVSDRQDGGAQIVLDPSSPIDSELLHPLIKVDENGVPVLENGKPVALDKSTLLERSLAGLTAQEVMRRKKADNYIPEKGEAHIDDLGEFQPGWLSNDVLSEMFAKNRLNPEQKRIIREMNRMIRDGKGGRAVMINFPATTRNKAGKVIYKTQGATLRDTVPVAITISKDGNLLFGLMSVNKLQENIQKRSQSRRGKKLYGGNVDLILRDTQAMMQFHKDGIDSIEYFKDKYGAVEATERKNFINTMFGLLNQKEQAVLNPMLIEDGVKSRDNVYRTYRADRVSKAVAMSPEDYPAMPFSYEATSQVKMPEQTRQMPEEPITSSSEKWKSMSNEEKDAYVFTPVEMTPSNRAEFDARVESGSLPADTPVVDINRSNLLTSRYGPPSSSATGNINTWIDDNTGKPVAVAFAENGNIPTKREQSQTPRYMPEKTNIHEETGLPLNPDGTVTVYHGTTKSGAEAIKKTGMIRSAAEPDVYFTTEPTSETTGYGDGSVVAIKIDPDKLILDDEFPDGRKDFRVEVGKSKQMSVNVLSDTQLTSSSVRFMPEKVDVDGDKGINAPSGSLGELRKNVEIKSSDLPSDTKSNPKFVARTGKEEPWKVMDGPLRIRSGNYLTPLPNIKIEKTKEFSVQNQDLVGNALIASQTTSQNPKEIKKQQVAESNVLVSLDKINSAVQDIENDPFKFVDVKGYAEIMKKSGVAGDVLIPPSSLKIMLNNPDYFTELLSGGYHGDKTVAGIRESAMSGLDAVVEMRQIINGRPPELITALHHLWGTLSKQLPPLQQEALWMRMIVNKKVMDQIQASINGTFNLTPEQWKNIVSSARSETVGTYGKLGENATSNANSFYLMLNKHNGRWNEVSDVYKNNDAVKMRYAFNTLGHGATGIKNKVQSFIGLTFGIKGNVLDRWRFVDMYLDDAMKITGAKTPRDYFKYEGKLKNVPVDKIGIYKNYGTLENNQSLFSLMLYSAMDRVSQIAIDSSPSMRQLLGNHADPGGLHWLSWNAIKNEAVGHSSLDITKNFIKKYKTDGDFSKLTVDNFLEFVNNTEAFVEGTSGAGNEITRLTLKNGTFNYSKK